MTGALVVNAVKINIFVALFNRANCTTAPKEREKKKHILTFQHCDETKMK